MNALRDYASDADRYGKTKDRASCMKPIDASIKTLTDEAAMDRAMGRPTVGTRN